MKGKCNILIPYETWINRNRGMPDWGHPTSVKVDLEVGCEQK